MIRLILILLLLLPATDCAKNPVNHRYELTLISSADEVRLGEEQDKAVLKLYGKTKDEKLQHYISTLGARLVAVAHPRPFQYHFTVINSGEVNAFALPGGYIYITRGALAAANSEAEVAGILGHEIGHVTARHYARQQVRAMGLQIGSLIATVFLGEPGLYLQRYIDVLFTGVYQSFGRRAELQADQLGQEYAFKAGWDPRETTRFLKTLDRTETNRNRGVFHGFFASHPETSERIRKAEARGDQMVNGTFPGKKERNRFLSMLSGLPYGNPPELGEFEKNRYRNVDSGLSILFPENWENIIVKGGVISRKPEGSEFIQLLITEPKDKTYLAHLTRKEDYFIKLREMAEMFESKSGWRRESEERTVIHSIPTFVAEYRLQSGLGRFYSTTAHFMIHKKKLLILLAFSPVGRERLSDYYFRRLFESVRPLETAEASELKPRKLTIYRVRVHDTFESISRHFYGTPDRARKIAEFNGFLSRLDPRPGDLLKIIVRISDP